MDQWKKAEVRTKFDSDSGPELIVFREPGLRPEDVIRMQVGMLENNRLAGTIPYRREMTDGTIVFRYQVSGLRKLRAALASGTMRESDWEGFFAAVGQALREGGDYCIRETEYALDPDWIWVRNDIKEAKLIAVPVVGLGTPERAWEQWKALYECLVANGLPEAWRGRLRPSQWEKSTFSHFLWLEAAEGVFVPAGRSGQMPGNDAMNSGERGGGIADVDQWRSAPGGNSVIGETFPDSGDGETMRFAAPRVTPSEWIRLLAAVACAIVFVVKPNVATFIVACLSCVPLAMTLIRRYGGEKQSRGGESGTAAPAEPPDVSDPDAPPPFVQPAIPRSSFSYASEPMQGAAQTTATGPSDADAEALALRTVLLDGAAPGDTVLLSAPNEGARATLEILYENSDRVDTVELEDGTLVLGRGPEGVDIVVDHAAASRVHLEFERNGDAVRACDRGSTNGTYYMDRQMQPHERYELHDGDMLRLPGAVIRFFASPQNE